MPETMIHEMAAYEQQSTEDHTGRLPRSALGSAAHNDEDKSGAEEKQKAAFTVHPNSGPYAHAGQRDRYRHDNVFEPAVRQKAVAGERQQRNHKRHQRAMNRADKGNTRSDAVDTSC